MQHGQPVLDFSESDLEVPEPGPGDFRLGDLVILRSSVRFEQKKSRERLAEISKLSSVLSGLHILNDPEWDEVGIIVDTNDDIEYGVEVIWCRKTRKSFNERDELSIVQRA